MDTEPRQRALRVFVSSTFLDLQAERDELVKRVFPRLRRLCESRGVVWSEVDLRWGITDEQRAEGAVLPICLSEIRNCRPFFIGILGERYGWVPETLPPALVEAEGWLGACAGRSVTELEMLHGVLNDPAMAGHAFFYFRDPKFLQALPPEKRIYYEEGPLPSEVALLGQAEAERRAAGRKRRLAELKGRIRASGLPVLEDFATPEELGQLVLAQMLSLIDRLFPESAIPDPLARERAEHAAFAKARRSVYLEPEGAFARLDAHARGDASEALIVRAEPGGGKAALLANWAARLRARDPAAVVLEHYAGASRRGADLPSMLIRLVWELQQRLGVRGELPLDEAELPAAFADRMGEAAAKGRFVIILDGLDELDERGDAPELGWLPAALPPNARLIVSASGAGTLERLRARGWPELALPPLAPGQRRALIDAHLARYRKTLSPALAERVAAAPVAANPLCLLVLLEELRQHGEHETLARRVAQYLAPGPDGEAGPEQLFARILERCERDFEEQVPGLVRDAMSYLWAARTGLSETELLERIGNIVDPVPRGEWSPLYFALEHSLSMSGGLLRLANEHLRKAVAARYLPDASLQDSARLELAAYFLNQENGARKAAELPWLLAKTRRWEKLHEQLCDPGLARLVWEGGKNDLFRYWALLDAEGYRPAESYAGLILDPEEAARNYAWLQELLYHTGDFEAASSLTDTVLDNPSPDDAPRLPYAAALNHQGAALAKLGRLERALAVLEEAEQLQRKTGDADGLRTTLGNLSAAHALQGELDRSLALNAELVRLCRERGDRRGLQLALCNGAVHQLARGELDAARDALAEAERLCRELGTKLGLQACLGLQAKLLRARGARAAALKLLEEQERLCRELGAKPALRVCLRDQGVLRHEAGEHAAALAPLKEAARLAFELNDKRALADCLTMQFHALSALKDFAAAEAALKEAQSLGLEAGDKRRQALSLGERALSRFDHGELDDALALFENQERLVRELGDGKILAACLGGQAMIHKRRGRAERALALLKEQEQLCRELGAAELLAASLAEQASLVSAAPAPRPEPAAAPAGEPEEPGVQLARLLRELKLTVVNPSECSRCCKAISYEDPICVDCSDVLGCDPRGFAAAAREEIQERLWGILRWPQNCAAPACARCSGALGAHAGYICCFNESINGYAYYLCPSCDAYTVLARGFAVATAFGWDGDPGSWMIGPLSRADGDRDLALIKTCDAPDNENCFCETHEQFAERADWRKP